MSVSHKTPKRLNPAVHYISPEFHPAGAPETPAPAERSAPVRRLEDGPKRSLKWRPRDADDLARGDALMVEFPDLMPTYAYRLAVLLRAGDWVDAVAVGVGSASLGRVCAWEIRKRCVGRIDVRSRVRNGAVSLCARRVTP